MEGLGEIRDILTRKRGVWEMIYKRLLVPSYETYLT